MINNYVVSLIRTGAALAVGWLLSLPLAHPVLALLGQSDTDPASKEKLVSGLAVILTAAWYAAAHALEKRYPGASWLLGSSQQPAAYTSGNPLFTAGTGAVPSGTDLNPVASPSADPTAHSDSGGATT
jgi:hypothetical protein